MRGYLYVMSNPALSSGLIKVGRTSKHPEERRKELSSETAVPEPYVLEYWGLVKEYESMEKQVHQLLDDCRNTKNREFFLCSVPEAISAIRSIATILEEEINHKTREEVEQLQKQAEAKAREAEAARKLKEEEELLSITRAAAAQRLRQSMSTAEAREKAMEKRHFLLWLWKFALFTAINFSMAFAVQEYRQTWLLWGVVIGLLAQLVWLWIGANDKFRPDYSEEEEILVGRVRELSDDQLYKISECASMEEKRRLAYESLHKDGDWLCKRTEP